MSYKFPLFVIFGAKPKIPGYDKSTFTQIMSHPNDSPIPIAFQKLITALDLALFPLRRDGRAQIMVAKKTMEEFKRQKLPYDVSVAAMKRRGKRVSVRGPRNYRLSRLVQARWPGDGMLEDTVPALVYAYRGQVDFHLEDYAVNCPQGNWMFIPAGIAKPDEAHPYILDGSDRECEFLWIYPGPLIDIGIECFITRSTAKGNAIGQEYGTSAIKNNDLSHLFNALSGQLMDAHSNEVMHYLLCALLALLSHELRQGRAVIPWTRHLNQPVARSRDIMTEARKHVESHLHQELTIDKMARLLAVSPSTITRLFRRKTGKTFNQYLTEKRMEGAEILLRDSVLSVDEVALKVGLTYERLRILFHQKYGYAPGEHRKQKK